MAKVIFDRHPEADPYHMRLVERRPIDTPGSISVHGRVLNMYGQFTPGVGFEDTASSLRMRSRGGKAFWEDCFAEFPAIFDTKAERLEWFRRCLAQIRTRVPEGHPLTLSVPAWIGCDRAGGDWDDYLRVLKEFAKRDGFTVSIYDFEALEGSVSEATGQVACGAPASLGRHAQSVPNDQVLPSQRLSSLGQVRAEIMRTATARVGTLGDSAVPVPSRSKFGQDGGWQVLIMPAVELPADDLPDDLLGAKEARRVTDARGDNWVAFFPSRLRGYIAGTVPGRLDPIKEGTVTIWYRVSKYVAERAEQLAKRHLSRRETRSETRARADAPLEGPVLDEADAVPDAGRRRRGPRVRVGTI